MEFAWSFAKESRRWACGARISLMLALLAMHSPPNIFAGESEDAQFAQAEQEFATRKWTKAIDAFAQFAELNQADPRAPLAAYYAGEGCIKLNKYVEARAWYEQALRFEPNDKLTRKIVFRMGEAAFLASDLTAAKVDLKKFLDRFPKEELNAYVYLYLGQLETRSGNYEQGRDYFLAGLKDHLHGPTASRLRLSVGQAYQRLGDLSSAQRYFEYLAQSNDPLALDAQVALGSLLYQSGQHAAALEKLQPLLDVPVKTASTAHAAYWIAKILTAQQKHREAAAIAEEAIEFHANGEWLPHLCFTAAEAWRAAGDRPAAMANYRQVWEGWPTCEFADDALFLHVKLAFEVRDFDLVDHLAVAFEREQKSSTYWRNVELYHCRALLAEKRFEEAETASEQLRIRLGDRPANASVTPQVRGQLTEIATARYCAAAAMAGLQKHQLALSLLGTVDLQLLPADMTHDYYQARCMALQGLGRHSEAVTLLQHHIRNHAPGPELSRCRSQLILAFAAAGRWNEALAELQAFRTADKEDGAVPQVALTLAEKAYFAGEISLAAKIYERLISFNDHANIVAQATAGQAWSRTASNPAKIDTKTFDQLLERYPDSPLAAQAIILRARALEQKNELQDAVHLYELLVERYPRTSQAPDALLAAARLCADLGSQRDTVELLRRLTTEYPRYTHMDAALYLWAWALIDLGHSDAGDQLLQRLTNEFPRSRYWPDSCHRLAEGALGRNEPLVAKQLLDRLLLVDTEPGLRIESLLMRGKLAVEEENWADVSRFMNQVIEQQGEQSQRTAAEYWLAEADYRRGEYTSAARRWARLEGETRGQRDSMGALVSLRRAQTLAQLKKWDEAFELATNLHHEVEDFAERPELDLLLARCYLQKEKYAEARTALKRILEDRKTTAVETSAMAAWMIGESWLREKRYVEAITAYLDGYEHYQHPKWQAASLLQAGKCYEILNQWSKACEAYGVLIEDYSQTPYVAEARNRLTAANERSAERHGTTTNK